MGRHGKQRTALPSGSSARKGVLVQSRLRHYSQVGNLENTTSLLSLFYAGFIGVAVVLITDY
jgi:hypothetical protein